jgi:hypothetical protein
VAPPELTTSSDVRKEMLSRNKRARVEEAKAVEVDLEDDPVASSSVPKSLFDKLPECTVKAGNHPLALEKEMDKFHKLSADAQALCVKSVVRLFVMKGTILACPIFAACSDSKMSTVSGARREMINRLKVQEVLEKIDSEYKKLANAVLAISAQELKDVFGYQLVTGQELVGMKDGKKDEYFLLSTSGSKRLRTLLAQADKSGAYFGFMTVVLFSVLMAPSERVSCANLLTNVRKVDPRFPLHIATSKNAHSATALAIPELGDDFLGLLNRMKKVRVF